MTTTTNGGNVSIPTTSPVRRLAAELAVLTHFDRDRMLRGHDYGAGQRAGEISRRTRELQSRLESRTDANGRSGFVFLQDLLSELEPAELLDAYTRIGRPRLNRVAKAEVWRSNTPSSRRTVTAWEHVRDELERRVQAANAAAGIGTAGAQAELEAKRAAELEADPTDSPAFREHLAAATLEGR